MKRGDNISSFNKNGNVNSSSFINDIGGNILEGTHKTIDDPWVITESSTDIIYVTDNLTKVTPGKTYYLTCQSDRPWGKAHLDAETTANHAVTIWLYLYKVYNVSNYHAYDLPENFTARDHIIRQGLWKYTIPSGYTAARVRLNAYSDGSTPTTAKFWDIALIPEEDFCDNSSTAIKINNSKIVSNEMMEV